MSDEVQIERRTCCGSIGRCLQSPELKLYISYFLSAWGDRMWAFALSIALGSIGSHNMQLTAISGFVNSIAILFFAASLGRWIDKTPRLKSATAILIVNNVAVFFSAALLFSILYFPEKIVPIWNGALQDILIAVSILLCALSMLTSAGTKICLTKDWVIVISGSDKDKLARINAWTVRLSLTSLVVSPVIAGQIMASFGQAAGCFYICLWNVLSFGFEYLFLRLVYESCPALAIKPTSHQEEELKELHELKESDQLQEKSDEIVPPESVVVVHSQPPAKKNCCSFFYGHIVSALNGWRIYYNQTVFPAALGLAFLYLTVLGFDGITTVYIYSQGIKENLVAAAAGVGAILGITGSFVYPFLRKRIGVERCGLYALISQIACNSLAVISIWLPGSVFDPIGYFSSSSSETVTNVSTTLVGNSSTFVLENWSSLADNSSNLTTTETEPLQTSKYSIGAFLLGIVLARFGLWMADLSISQIMQENIADTERGVVNGVQNSINSTMNMIKDILVIILPDPRTFGILIVISFCSVSSGFVSYASYSFKKRGHLLPFHNQIKVCCSKRNECALDDEHEEIGKQSLKF